MDWAGANRGDIIEVTVKGLIIIDSFTNTTTTINSYLKVFSCLNLRRACHCRCNNYQSCPNITGTVAGLQKRFPFLAWQNENIREKSQHQSFGNTGNDNGAEIQQEKKKLEEEQLTGVLQNAIFSYDKDYIQLYKDLKNGNYNSGAGSLRHTKDKKSDNVENSGNLVEQETYALENAISLDPFTDYEKLYKDQEDSFANPPTTSQPFADEEIDRFPQTKNPNTFQQQSSLNNFKNKVSIDCSGVRTSSINQLYCFRLSLTFIFWVRTCTFYIHCIFRNKPLTENQITFLE